MSELEQLKANAEDYIFFCNHCGGNIDYSELNEYHFCNDCDGVFNDTDIDLMLMYGSYEIWTE